MVGTIRALTMLMVIASVAPGTPAHGEGSAQPAATADEPDVEGDLVRHPLKPPDTSSPRATFQSFLAGMNRSHRILMAAYTESPEGRDRKASAAARQQARQAQVIFERAVACLDLGKVPLSIRRQAGYVSALYLKEILDRIEIPPADAIPGGGGEGAYDEAEAAPARWRLPNTRIDIVRVTDGPRTGEYLFAPELVEQLPRLYGQVKNLPYRTERPTTAGILDLYLASPGGFVSPEWARWLPDWSEHRWLSMAAWQWIGFILVCLLGLLVVSRGYRWLLARSERGAPVARHRRRILFFVLCAAVLLGVRNLTHGALNISGPVLLVMTAVFGPIWWFLSAAFVLSATRVIAERIIESPRIDPEGLQASYIRALAAVIGFVLATSVFIYGLSRLGVSLLPLLTGVGIGGLAIALAAQPTLSNVIASFMIFADKPYRVGERVNVLGQVGDVESIGLRSTKIRLLTGPLAVIPNEKMAGVEIENIGRRPYVRRTFNITVTYDTPPEKIERAVGIVREILAESEAINQPAYPPRVYFNEFNADSLNIFVGYWFHPPDHWQAMEFAHRVNMRIKERFNVEGIDFAFPTQTLHLAGDQKRPLAVGRPPLDQPDR